jgi:hypothetical protein
MSETTVRLLGAILHHLAASSTPDRDVQNTNSKDTTQNQRNTKITITSSAPELI